MSVETNGGPELVEALALAEQAMWITVIIHTQD